MNNKISDCNCHIKKSQDTNEKEYIHNIITAQTNPYKRAIKMNDNVGGFELILNQPYNQVWSGNDFFRNVEYQENKLFYESPFKHISKR